jgi:protein ImuA
MTESPSLPALKARLAGFEQAIPPQRFTLGHTRLDAALNGGLARAHLHEVWPAASVDGASATGFALMLALRAGGRSGNIVWMAEDKGRHRLGALYAPGLAELGVDPACVLFVNAPDDTALLRAAGDVVRSPAAGTTVIVPSTPGAFDLTATRRLTLFAERSGVTAILLRPADPQAPSAAMTRWQVAAAPSTPLEAKAPGAPAFMVELVRQRGGAPVPPVRLEWDRDGACFTDLSRPLPADAGGGLLEEIA